MPLDFAPSPRSSVGLEWELALVDADSGNLRQVAPAVMDALAADERARYVKPEFLRNTLEVVSDVCDTVGSAVRDLEAGIAAIRDVIEPMRAEIMGAGTHPFAHWSQQQVTDKQRYATVVDRTQVWGRQQVVYGVHVHVGIEDRAKVLPIVRSLLVYVAHLQALSASSPYWGADDTGYASMRALIFQQLPTAGLPYQFAEWGQLEQYVDDMLKTGVIDDFTEVRWDVRPAPHFGTVEVRVCDGTSNVLELAALGALVHCLVEHFSTLLDEGRELPAMPRWFVHENKWRAARYGMDAIIILDADGNEELITDALPRLLDELAPVAARLGCTAELEGVHEIVRAGASYQRQRAVAAAHGGGQPGLEAVVRSLVAELRAGRPLPVG
ncbi:carboxylate-amine ligase [Isoptericola sp. CG 20/1183]|uniref:Putative glutamate--cysteine ligase 2 n=1 Tax=Isoptericola halotolerans TaxID=300560 RepID=A0ABX5EE68_9MICO|nr:MULTISPECIES: glutamate--cysteine ligase [Isoptericola]MCK0117914.1 glutamate--cysteine ligase [Isoptericola sp. S6320L]PRZ06995.1 carboxylate-amine ligase [Isoptericola halotolerans]PRZ07333.1 carboxylate-amine ligase [Isoptericola sp. CG 20/1183]